MNYPDPKAEDRPKTFQIPVRINHDTEAKTQKLVHPSLTNHQEKN